LPETFGDTTKLLRRAEDNAKLVPVRVLLASIMCEKGDLEGNLARHREVLAEARRADCDLVVFPEFSLTGSVNPLDHPDRAVPIDHEIVTRFLEAVAQERLGALFGLAERSNGQFFITQAYTFGGQMAGVQRKRHLAEDEAGFSLGSETAIFEWGAARFGSIICAEGGVDFTWDASAAAGAQILFFCSAPGLHGRRGDHDAWRAGFDWWEGCGLSDARHHARRLGIWVAMATQAGSTIDEDFPGIAALVAPTGDVVDRLSDWRPGTLVVDVPISIDVDPVRSAVRVLVIDGAGSTLLVEFGDEGTGRRWWVPPGGGIELGEDDLMAARRELLEELGRDDLVIGPCLGRRGGTFHLDGGWFTQYERWYLCRCDHFQVDAAVLARGRSEGIRDLRWWLPAELRAQGIDTGPRSLANLVDNIRAGRLPDPDGDLGR